MTEVKKLGVKKRRRGFTRLSSKNQATIPVAVLAEAGLRSGDELRVAADGAGKIVLERVDDPLAALAGSLTGVFEPGFLKGLREEWDPPSSIRAS